MRRAGSDPTFRDLVSAAGDDPQLQSVEAYRDLLVQLEGTENRIAAGP